MAFGDYAIDIHELDAQLAVDEDIKRHIKPQFVRPTDTAKWFAPTKNEMIAKVLYYRAFVAGSTSARWSQIATAAAAEFPVPMDFKWQEMSIIYNDLRVLQKSVKYNLLEQSRTASKFSVADLVTQIIGDVEQDIGYQLNSALHRKGTGELATIKGIYDVDGTSFTGAAGHAPAYINITGGSIGQFQRNDVLQVIDQADGTTVNVLMKVHDIVYGPDGPLAAGTKVADIGPGIIAEPCAVDGSTTAGAGWDTVWNAVGTPAATDYLARSGEFTTTTTAYKGIHGFPDIFDSTVDMYRDGDMAAIDREAAGNSWLNPYFVIAAADGSEVDFDADVHLRELQDNVPFLASITAGRTSRAAMGQFDGVSIKGAMVAITSPAIVNSAVDDAKATQRFTTDTAISLNAAQQKELFGDVGFRGIVYHSASIPSIALQSDVMCLPNRMYILDPNSFFYATPPGTKGNIEWMKPNGVRFAAIQGATLGTLTYYVQGAAHTMMALSCDQPSANLMIRGIKAA